MLLMRASNRFNPDSAMRHHLFFTLAILLLFCTASVLPADDQPGYVKGTGVILRASHATYYESLAKLQENTPLSIVSRQGDWVEVRLPVRITGWIQKDRVDDSFTVLDAICPIYTAPGIYFTAFYTASQGEKLTPEGNVDGDWLCVYAPTEATGWIHKDFVGEGTPAPVAIAPAPALPPPPPANTVVETQPTDASAGLESATLAARTLAIRQEQERQELEMQQEQERLDALRQQAEDLKEATSRHNSELEQLQTEAQRLETLRDGLMIRAVGNMIK